MLIQLMSDIHLEKLKHPYVWNIPKTDAELIILAGDIGVGIRGVQWAIEQSEKLDKDILYLRGNHESWDNQLESLFAKMKFITDGTRVHVMEDESIQYDDIVFLCCTLWTDYMLYGHKARPEIMNMLRNDFSDNLLINKPFKFDPLESLEIHEKSMEWLRERLMSIPSFQKKVVVTHHAPTIYALSPRYRFNDLASAAFASDLEGFILETQPNYWFHGHTHFNHEMKIGKTIITCNQKGYPSEKFPKKVGLPGFDPKRVYEI